MIPKLKIPDSSQTRNFGDLVKQNKIANPAQDAELPLGLGHFELVHPCRVAGTTKEFLPILSNPVGPAAILINE